MRAATGAPWVLVVGAAQKEATGARFLPLLLAKADGANRQWRLPGGADASARAHLVTQILDLLRKELR